MKALLVVTAVLEAVTGLALVLSPSLPAYLLLGTSLDGAAAPVVARLAGAALLSLGVVCWLAVGDARSRAASGLVAGLLIYNVGAAAILAHARLGVGLSGIALWPAAAAHAALAIACVLSLRRARGVRGHRSVLRRRLMADMSASRAP